jgi:hypothetical protein
VSATARNDVFVNNLPTCRDGNRREGMRALIPSAYVRCFDLVALAAIAGYVLGRATTRGRPAPEGKAAPESARPPGGKPETGTPISEKT